MTLFAGLVLIVAALANGAICFLLFRRQKRDAEAQSKQSYWQGRADADNWWMGIEREAERERMERGNG